MYKRQLRDFAEKNGMFRYEYYVDDGYTGRNFNRPSFQRMIADIEAGKIGCVITKDLSRLGRNYIEAGSYIEIFFPKHNVRYIAITDGVDSLTRQEMDITPFKNILNDMYSRDISKKVLAGRMTRSRQGKFCGCLLYTSASESEYERGDELETHAYEWIHTIKPEEIFKMKFDVIIGNPPYQLSDGGNGVSAAPIFQHFVEQAIKLKPRYLSMIIPARWYAGGKGLNEFRELMLNDAHVRKLVDYESSKDCFDAVNIAGGICYFLWDRDHAGHCEITNWSNDNSVVMERQLNEFPILIRSNLAVSIVHKVLNVSPDVHSNHAYPRNPFGFATNYRGRSEQKPGDIELLTSVGFCYVSRKEVTKNTDIIDSYKVLIGRLVPNNGELDVNPKDGYKVITDTRIIGPGQINTETYLDIGVFDTKREAVNFDKYLKSKLPRFLLRQAISSLNVTRECFRFVPYLDFKEEWTDQKLYKTYGLTDEEISFVEYTIRPME